MAKDFRRTHLDGRPLHPQTQMTAFGYDPALSEGAVKPPVFLTSTFVFQSAEQAPNSSMSSLGASQRLAAWEREGWFIPASTIPIWRSSRIDWRSMITPRAR
jgi:hypothetical protein